MVIFTLFNGIALALLVTQTVGGAPTVEARCQALVLALIPGTLVYLSSETRGRAGAAERICVVGAFVFAGLILHVI